MSQIIEMREYYNYGTSLSGWHTLTSRLNPFTKSIRIPRLVETLLRSTDIKSIVRLNETKAMLDILIEPDVSEIPLMEFKSYKRISDIGYDAAVKVLVDHGLVDANLLTQLQEEHQPRSNNMDWQTKQLHS